MYWQNIQFDIRLFVCQVTFCITFFQNIMNTHSSNFVLCFQMVYTYKRKTDRGAYGSDALSNALDAVKGGTPLLRVSQMYNIPRKTLRRHRDGVVANPGVMKLGRYTTVLGLDVERELHDHVVYMERSLYGLTLSLPGATFVDHGVHCRRRL